MHILPAAIFPDKDEAVYETMFDFAEPTGEYG